MISTRDVNYISVKSLPVLIRKTVSEKEWYLYQTLLYKYIQYTNQENQNANYIIQNNTNNKKFHDQFSSEK